MNNNLKAILLIIVLVSVGGVLEYSLYPQREQTEEQNPAPLSRIGIKVGMERMQVEKMISEALGTPLKYDLYGTDLQNNPTVGYTDGTVVLEVSYNAGAPAPWVAGSDGAATHQPPVDQTVRSFQIRKADNFAD